MCLSHFPTRHEHFFQRLRSMPRPMIHGSRSLFNVLALEGQGSGMDSGPLTQRMASCPGPMGSRETRITRHLQGVHPSIVGKELLKPPRRHLGSKQLFDALSLDLPDTMRATQRKKPSPEKQEIDTYGNAPFHSGALA